MPQFRHMSQICCAAYRPTSEIYWYAKRANLSFSNKPVLNTIQ